MALPTPIEEPVSSTVTAIRLLHQVAQIKGFNIGAYGDDVRLGTAALHQQENESYSEFMHRINEADAERPDLALKVTQAKHMIFNALDPVGLPVECIRQPGTKIGVGAQLTKYKKFFPDLLEEAHPWYPKVRKAIELGENALLDPRLIIRT
ncbi:MAG: hypothetical protein H0W89_01150 [Candidatus Levybacteria bacterium]|nr:hypothetical protein [Candidatus Levybacteria bacterium]